MELDILLGFAIGITCYYTGIGIANLFIYLLDQLADYHSERRFRREWLKQQDHLLNHSQVR